MSEPITHFVQGVLGHPVALARLLEEDDVEAFLTAAQSVARALEIAISREDLERALGDARRSHLERWLR